MDSSTIAGGVVAGIVLQLSVLSYSAERPCDIYQSGGTPCVAAHSTTRALYIGYDEALYQVRRTTDNATMDVGLISRGGIANSAQQDHFCANVTCRISIIYDQSPRGNHLVVAPAGGWLSVTGIEANATDAQIYLDGRVVYGIFTRGNGFTTNPGVGYRNNKTNGVPVGDNPEGIYMVASGTHYNAWCCFDYGNAGTTNEYEGPGTMETIYFGSSTQWGRGSGDGPWVMADLEAGLFAGVSFDPPATNISINHDYITAMLKGDSGNHFALRGGNAQSGALLNLYDGPRPDGGYNPMRKGGAIILGVGGDNSNTGEGTFFEGAIVEGYPTETTDNAIQANIISAGYGRQTSEAPGARFFQSENFGGLSTKLPEGQYILSQLQAASIPDNAISSMQIDEGLTVELFDGDQFQISLGMFQDDIPSFESINMANMVSSLKIYETPTVPLQKGRARILGGVRWSNGYLIHDAQLNSKFELVFSNGRSRELLMVDGRAYAGQLPRGFYLLKYLDGKKTIHALAVIQ